MTFFPPFPSLSERHVGNKRVFVGGCLRSMHQIWRRHKSRPCPLTGKHCVDGLKWVRGFGGLES